MQADKLICKKCKNTLSRVEDRIVCNKCDREYGKFIDDIAVYNNAKDKAGFFDVHATTKLAKMYANYSYEKFSDCLEKKELYEMDFPNKKIGVAKKFWWEDCLGKIEGQSILEVGCGMNYIVPYWLDSGNKVSAFDVCKESVLLLKDILKKINLYSDQIDLFVGDVEDVELNNKFDIINVNNVLHHVDDKEKAFYLLKKHLKDDGRLLIVEPNYYYPFRWIIQTEFLESINFVKAFFTNNNMIEKGEKGIVFSELKNSLNNAGFKIELNEFDKNIAGYALTYFIDNNQFLPNLIYLVDKYFLNHLVPAKLVPFEYLILSKA